MKTLANILAPGLGAIGGAIGGAATGAAILFVAAILGAIGGADPRGDVAAAIPFFAIVGGGVGAIVGAIATAFAFARRRRRDRDFGIRGGKIRRAARRAARGIEFAYAATPICDFESAIYFAALAAKKSNRGNARRFLNRVAKSFAISALRKTIYTAAAMIAAAAVVMVADDCAGFAIAAAAPLAIPNDAIRAIGKDPRIVRVRIFRGFVPNSYGWRAIRRGDEWRENGGEWQHGTFEYDARRSYGRGPDWVGYSARGGRLASR